VLYKRLWNLVLCTGLAYIGQLAYFAWNGQSKSILGISVLIDIVLACRNKSRNGAFGIGWAGFGFGGGGFLFI
jgi:hypothetical protein